MQAKKCRFCGCRQVKAACGWPIVWKGDVRVEDLSVGDYWLTPPKRGKIVDVEEFEQTRKIWVVFPGSRDPHAFNRFRGDLQLSERIRACGKACCFRHRRRLGPGCYYCSDHWTAWEAVS